MKRCSTSILKKANENNTEMPFFTQQNIKYPTTCFIGEPVGKQVVRVQNGRSTVEGNWAKSTQMTNAIILLGICPKERCALYSERHMNKAIHLTVLQTATNQKQPKCLSVGNELNYFIYY